MLSPALVVIGFLMVAVTELVVPVAGEEWSFRPSYNEVYPADPSPATPPNADFSASRVRNMSRTTDLREFIMQFVQDVRICSDPTLRDLILAEDGGDERAKVWWSRRCGGRRGGGFPGLPAQSESTLIRYRRKSSNRDSPQNSVEHSRSDARKWKKIKKLMTDKRIECKPKKMAVPLPNQSPQSRLQPECVYIKQCGGCCNSPQLECLPVKIKNKTFPAMELTSRDNGFQFTHDKKIRMVTVQEHKRCRCECKVRSEHCGPHQEYNESACQCQCPSNQSRSCPSKKVWNEEQCRCECRRSQNCPTGRYFDVNSCRC